MAGDDQDQSQKTEDPSAKRMRDARGKGDVAVSREVQNWFVLVAITLFLAFMAPGVARDVRETLTRFLAAPHDIILDRYSLPDLMGSTLLRIGAAIAAPVLLFMVVGVGAGLIQNGLIFSPEKLKPNLSKISLFAGAKRLFSFRSVTELAKSMLKLALVVGIAYMAVSGALPTFELLPVIGIEPAMKFVYALAVRITAYVAGLLTVIALFDLAYQRYQHTKKLRMTKQEVKEEFKQTEGDPLIKQRIASIRNERARQRMIQAVPKADVVITNPTHFAAALKYEPETMRAPMLVAKGADHLAFRIREVAKNNDVPIVENPPLARALFEGVDIDQEVKPEHYQAVAEIIAYVMRLKGRPIG